jgi:hypothetical protein
MEVFNETEMALKHLKRYLKRVEEAGLESQAVRNGMPTHPQTVTKGTVDTGVPSWPVIRCPRCRITNRRQWTLSDEGHVVTCLCGATFTVTFKAATVSADVGDWFEDFEAMYRKASAGGS